MGDDKALLAAIHANPDEDTERLVYADWLQEHDQSEKAEFIRVQIELARQPTPARRTELEARQRELLNADNQALRIALLHESDMAVAGWEHNMVLNKGVKHAIESMQKDKYDGWHPVYEEHGLRKGMAPLEHINLFTRGFVDRNYKFSNIGNKNYDKPINQIISELNDCNYPINTLTITGAYRPLSAEQLATIHRPDIRNLNLFAGPMDESIVSTVANHSDFRHLAALKLGFCRRPGEYESNPDPFNLTRQVADILGKAQGLDGLRQLQLSFASGACAENQGLRTLLDYADTADNKLYNTVIVLDAGGNHSNKYPMPIDLQDEDEPTIVGSLSYNTLLKLRAHNERAAEHLGIDYEAPDWLTQRIEQTRPRSGHNAAGALPRRPR